jgi:hypothetical protein
MPASKKREEREEEREGRGEKGERQRKRREREKGERERGLDLVFQIMFSHVSDHTETVVLDVR